MIRQDARGRDVARDLAQVAESFDNVPERLASWQRGSGVRARLAHEVLKLLGVELPPQVPVGRRFRLVHGAVGLVVHANTVIGDDVRLYTGVTLGHADLFDRAGDGGIDVEDGAIVCSGAKVLFRTDRRLTLGRNSIVGANAVVLSSVPPGEIWAGCPATRIGYNSRHQLQS